MALHMDPSYGRPFDHDFNAGGSSSPAETINNNNMKKTIVKIPFTHVRGVSRESTVLIIPNAIAITTSKTTYVFRSFWDREEAYYEIKNAHRLSNGLPPLPIQQFRDAESNVDPDNDEERLFYAAAKNLYMGKILPQSESNQHWMPPAPSEDSEEDDERIRQGSESDEWKTETARATLQSQYDSHLTTPIPSDPILASTETLESAFLSSIQTLERAAEGSKTVSVNVDLDGYGRDPSKALQKYFQLFLSDDAPYSLVPFHLSQGDSDVSLTQWDGNDNEWKTRELRYLHPYTGAMGTQSTSRTVKAQRFRSFGKYGMILQTTTYLEDVPMSDCFQLEDRCILRPSQVSDLNVQVVMSIKFIKSTMVKSIIEQRSLSESKQVWQNFFSMVKQKVPIPTRSIPQPEPTPERGQEVQIPEKKKTCVTISPRSLNSAPSKVSRKRTSKMQLYIAFFCVALPWFLLFIIACTEAFKQALLRAEVTGLMNGLEVVLDELYNYNYACGSEVMSLHATNTCSSSPEELKQNITNLIVETYAKHRFFTRRP